MIKDQGISPSQLKMSVLAHTVREPTLDLLDAQVIAYADLQNLCPESLVEKKMHGCVSSCLREQDISVIRPEVSCTLRPSSGWMWGPAASPSVDST